MPITFKIVKKTPLFIPVFSNKFVTEFKIFVNPFIQKSKISIAVIILTKRASSGFNAFVTK